MAEDPVTWRLPRREGRAAALFLLPHVGDDYAGQWRTPVDATLDFDLDPGFVLAGQSPSAALRTNYELMFVRAAVNPAVTPGSPPGTMKSSPAG